MSVEEITDKQRVNFLKSSLAALYPARLVTRDLLSYEQRDETQLKAGIYTIVSLGVDSYQNYNGGEATDGNHRIALFGQILLAEGQAGEAVEDAEFTMVEEIKAYLRAAAPVRPAELCCLVATGYMQTGQLDAPYGGVRFDLECPRG